MTIKKCFVGSQGKGSARRIKAAILALNLVFAGLLGLSPSSYAIDVDTGDWVTAPAGTDIGLFYLQHAERSKSYSNGHVALSNAQLQSDVAILRYVHWTTLAGHPFLPQFLLPYGRLQGDGNLSSLGSTSGTGDLILATPLWLKDNKESREAFVISPYLILPTGSYDKTRPLNLGDNITKFDLQLAYTHGIGEKFNIELTGDVEYFGKNTDANITKKLLTEVQGYLSYQWTGATRLAVGLAHTYGGEATVSGVAQNDRVSTTKAILTASTFVDGKNQLMFSYGKDLSISNGLREDSRFNFRLLHIF